MSDEHLISVMRRKAGAGRPAPDVTAMSVDKALSLATAKATEEGTGMVMQVTQVTEEMTSINRLSDSIPEHALLVLLEGPDTQYGLAVFNLAVTTSVVEQLTTGKVQKHAPEARKPTSTDAVMCFELIDRVLRQFETYADEIANPPEIHGYRAAAQLSEARSIALAFDDVRYRLFRVHVDMGAGARSGELMFVFPYEQAKPIHDPNLSADWAKDFQSLVMKSEATLETVLQRVTLSLADAANLEVGMTIPIPHDALSRVEIMADGQTLSHGRLGQVNGHRALRLALSVDTETIHSRASQVKLRDVPDTNSAAQQDPRAVSMASGDAATSATLAGTPAVGALGVASPPE